MYCTTCGARLPENSKFCNLCGAPIVANTPEQPASEEVDELQVIILEEHHDQPTQPQLQTQPSPQPQAPSTPTPVPQPAQAQSTPVPQPAQAQPSPAPQPAKAKSTSKPAPQASQVDPRVEAIVCELEEYHKKEVKYEQLVGWACVTVVLAIGAAAGIAVLLNKIEVGIVALIPLLGLAFTFLFTVICKRSNNKRRIKKLCPQVGFNPERLSGHLYAYRDEHPGGNGYWPKMYLIDWGNVVKKLIYYIFVIGVAAAIIGMKIAARH